eukprot:Phypoly_transcript_07012.p1 GENE.Phypoly_transcript_07012~~Phypoly_transcript_07012.p1  ORF type:complete len:438 (+),score=72.83 Phypoly_transcript_07012:214-1527(+)
MDMEVEVSEIPDANGRFTIKHKSETLSFDKGFFVSVKAIQILRKKNEGKVLVVGVAGPSGAGKTSLAQKIISVLPKSVLISLDNYLDTSQKVIDENFDDYRLMDFGLLGRNLQDLLDNKPTQTPLYDFRKSGRYAYKTMSPPESKVVVVEGTYALHESVRPYLDLQISISGGVHFDLIKRVFRDIQRTGQKPQEAIQQITETVHPMYKAFIEPDLNRAQIRIVNKFNPFSGLLNPYYILKALKKDVTEKDVLNILTPGKIIGPTIAKYYDIYLHPPGVDPKMCMDWIRMRNSDGVYSIMFFEDIKEGGFIISPRVNYTVSVKILSGLMALGYQIGAIIHRKSMIFKDDRVKISFDQLEELGETYMQVKGLDRQQVAEVMQKLTNSNEGEYIPKSYIDLYQEKYKKTLPPVPPAVPSPLPSSPDASKDMLNSFIGAKL